MESFEPHQIAFPKGISDLHKYYNADTEENFHAGVFGEAHYTRKVIQFMFVQPFPTTI